MRFVYPKTTHPGKTSQVFCIGPLVAAPAAPLHGSEDAQKNTNDAAAGRDRFPIKRVMKKLTLIFALLASSASAAWSDLKEGLDAKSAEQFVGAPLFVNRTRGGTVMNWVYDCGGYILFENGRVKFWQAPRDAKR